MAWLLSPGFGYATREVRQSPAGEVVESMSYVTESVPVVVLVLDRFSVLGA